VNQNATKPADAGAYMAELERRASLRQTRLFACACVRAKLPAEDVQRWLETIAIAELYADGELGAEEFESCKRSAKIHQAPYMVYGDMQLAFYTNAQLTSNWLHTETDSPYSPEHPDYELVLARCRVFEELLGPEQLPAFSPEWRTSAAVAIASGMYESRDFSAMPILADALQDAGCENADVLNHCRDPKQLHVRGCWVVDLVLDKA